MMEYGLIPFINNVTRPSSNTCIDHVFIKTKSEKNVLSIIPQLNITDHYPIILSIKNISKNRNNEPNPLKTDEVELTRLIKAQDWLAVYQNREADNATNTFTEILNTIKISTSKEIHLKQKNLSHGQAPL